ncbi:MAG TPA: UMP kinase [bacterium (Candidatus Stahlbacteria)]|nr:UMP kinase [Candidatus Stahlbacteria bacterium]
MGRSPKYKRVVLKISGEIFGDGSSLDIATLDRISDELIKANKQVEIALVVGGGNIWRGEEAHRLLGISKVTADYIGMIGTLINGLTLQSVLESKGEVARIMSAIGVDKIAEPYIRRRAIKHLEKGRIIIFTCGTGRPYFTTDTAAALIGIEIDADVILKGTKVDGVYDADPIKTEHAKKYDKLSYSDVINKKLGIMDLTAITLCSENKLPIIVFNIMEKDSLEKIIMGEPKGTSIS